MSAAHRLAAARAIALAVGIAATLCAWARPAAPAARAPPAEATVPRSAPPAPAPLLREGQPVDWWFVFKFNARSFPGCGAGARARSCPFGGKPQPYPYFGQQYVVASSTDPTPRKGAECTGETVDDPVGATFAQVYSGRYNFVIWNDQFYDDPRIQGCSGSCGAPWGHSKGVLAWDDAGSGFVMQVTTPSWPAAGSAAAPRRADGNTLGCVLDNNVKVSQHFFASRLARADVVLVLEALRNASVATNPRDGQLARNGGPAEIRALVDALGSRSKSGTVRTGVLSDGVTLISKPSALNVPPWQMVSSVLGGVALRTATWWASPRIYTSTPATRIGCWSEGLREPGAVEIATTGSFEGRAFGLQGGGGPDFNHAKIGVSLDGPRELAIFGDMNQQGAIAGNCASSQNGRGGLFFVVESKPLHDGVAALIAGETAPTKAPKN